MFNFLLHFRHCFITQNQFQLIEEKIRSEENDSHSITFFITRILECLPLPVLINIKYIIMIAHAKKSNQYFVIPRQKNAFQAKCSYFILVLQRNKDKMLIFQENKLVLLRVVNLMLLQIAINKYNKSISEQYIKLRRPLNLLQSLSWSTESSQQ